MCLALEDWKSGRVGGWGSAFEMERARSGEEVCYKYDRDAQRRRAAVNGASSSMARWSRVRSRLYVALDWPTRAMAVAALALLAAIEPARALLAVSVPARALVAAIVPARAIHGAREIAVVMGPMQQRRSASNCAWHSHPCWSISLETFTTAYQIVCATMPGHGSPKMQVWGRKHRG